MADAIWLSSEAARIAGSWWHSLLRDVAVIEDLAGSSRYVNDAMATLWLRDTVAAVRRCCLRSLPATRPWSCEWRVTCAVTLKTLSPLSPCFASGCGQLLLHQFLFHLKLMLSLAAHVLVRDTCFEMLQPQDAPDEEVAGGERPSQQASPSVGAPQDG